MPRNLEAQISEALTAYIDNELHSAVQDQLCHATIADSLNLDEIVEHIDLDYRFDEAISNWLANNMEEIANQYRNTVEHIVSGMAEVMTDEWIAQNQFRLLPFHRRCVRWVRQVCKNKLTWRKKNEA